MAGGVALVWGRCGAAATEGGGKFPLARPGAWTGVPGGGLGAVAGRFAPGLAGLFDFTRRHWGSVVSILFVLFFMDLFDTVGTLVGVAERAGLMRGGTLPRARQALLSAAVGTVSGTLLGPSTVRDTAGFLVDWQLDPLTYWHDSTITYSLAALRVVDVRASLLGVSNVLEEGAVDKYTFMRDAYLQRRRYLIYDGNLPEDKEGGKSPDGKDTGDATVSPYQRFTPNWPVFRR